MPWRNSKLSFDFVIAVLVGDKKAAIEDVHYHADRNIDRNQIIRLADCTFIDRFESVLITGSTILVVC
jgi:hypothetical protein